jgi:hypothetical protein
MEPIIQNVISQIGQANFAKIYIMDRSSSETRVTELKEGQVDSS